MFFFFLKYNLEILSFLINGPHCYALYTLFFLISIILSIMYSPILKIVESPKSFSFIFMEKDVQISVSSQFWTLPRRVQ